MVGSFIDMMGAAAGRIIAEAMEDESLSQRVKDTLQGLADLEQSRGPAAFHILSLASTFDANLKLLRQQGALSVMDLQPHLTQAAYRLPFDPLGSRLFGKGIMEILGLEQDLSSKKQKKAVDVGDMILHSLPYKLHTTF